MKCGGQWMGAMICAGVLGCLASCRGEGTLRHRGPARPVTVNWKFNNDWPVPSEPGYPCGETIVNGYRLIVYCNANGDPIYVQRQGDPHIIPVLIDEAAGAMPTGPGSARATTGEYPGTSLIINGQGYRLARMPDVLLPNPGKDSEDLLEERGLLDAAPDLRDLPARWYYDPGANVLDVRIAFRGDMRHLGLPDPFARDVATESVVVPLVHGNGVAFCLHRVVGDPGVVEEYLAAFGMESYTIAGWFTGAEGPGTRIPEYPGD